MKPANAYILTIDGDSPSITVCGLLGLSLKKEN
jgi:hypothetical protein